MSNKNVEGLGKAMRSTWKYKKDNKLRGAYGDTNFGTKTIRVNKSLAKKRPLYKCAVNEGASKYPDVLATIVHETYHKDHPKATEKQTRKAERKIVSKMSPKQKQKMYSKVK